MQPQLALARLDGEVADALAVDDEMLHPLGLELALQPRTSHIGVEAAEPLQALAQRPDANREHRFEVSRHHGLQFDAWHFKESRTPGRRPGGSGRSRAGRWS